MNRDKIRNRKILGSKTPEEIHRNFAYDENGVYQESGNKIAMQAYAEQEVIASESTVEKGDVYIYKSLIRYGKRKPNLTINEKYTIEKIKYTHQPYPVVAIRDNGGVLRWYFFGNEFKRNWELYPKPVDEPSQEWVNEKPNKEGWYVKCSPKLKSAEAMYVEFKNDRLVVSMPGIGYMLVSHFSNDDYWIKLPQSSKN